MGQTPLPATLRNYYQLVYDRMVSCVVQLTGVVEGGKEVCAPYWPSAGEREKRFGEYTVLLDKEEQKEGYVIRTFSLGKEKVEFVKGPKSLCYQGLIDREREQYYRQ